VGGAAEPSLRFSLNDNQNEQNYYGVVAYQKSSGNLNYQVSAYARNSSVHYVPGNLPATLITTAASPPMRIASFTLAGRNGPSYTLGDSHTLARRLDLSA
jgi:hypothetical protein